MKWRVFLGCFVVFGGILGFIVAAVLIRQGLRANLLLYAGGIIYAMLMMIQILAGVQMVDEAKEMKENGN